MSDRIVRIAYKPMGRLLGAGAGIVAGLVFTQVWKSLRHEQDAPSTTDKDRGWAEIMLAAALQGAIFGVVKATVDHAGAKGIHHITGPWPS